MIVQIAIEIDAGGQAAEIPKWDTPDLVARVIAAKLGDYLELVDSATGKTATVQVKEVCGVYGAPQRPG